MENNQPAASSAPAAPTNTLVDHKEISINPASVPNSAAQVSPSNQAPDNIANSATSPSRVPIPPEDPENTKTELDFKNKNLNKTDLINQEDDAPSKDYFLPINTTTQKRSIKISAGLTLVILLLAFVLVDLMLDSGMVLLVQKLPHTHIFNTGMLN